MGSVEMVNTLVDFGSQAQLAGVGIVCSFIVVLFGAWRRGASILVSLAALGIAGVGAAIGSRLYWFAMHDAEWNHLLGFEAGFSSFGAIFGGGLAVVVLRFAFYESEIEFRRGLDVLTPAGLVALAWARLGCLPNGCDYGVRTDVPWGIRYPRGSQVFEFHSQMGWSSASDMMSQAVHPLPIYLFFACAVAVIITGISSSRPGTSAGWGVLAYAALRLPTETFRAPSAAGSVLGVSTTLVASVALFIAAAAWLTHLRMRPIFEEGVVARDRVR